MMHTLAQVLLDYLTAAATHLAGVAWIHLHDTTTGTLSLVRRELHKLTPRRVGDGFGETMILQHPAYIQSLKGDDAVFVYQFTALFMGKVAASVGDAFMNMRDHLAPLVALRASFLGRVQLALRFRQSLFFDAKEFGTVNRLAVRQDGKFF